VCCVWNSLVWVCGSECVLCVGQFGVGLWRIFFAVCGTVWRGFVGVSVFCVVGQFCVGMLE